MILDYIRSQNFYIYVHTLNLGVQDLLLGGAEDLDSLLLKVNFFLASAAPKLSLAPSVSENPRQLLPPLREPSVEDTLRPCDRFGEGVALLVRSITPPEPSADTRLATLLRANPAVACCPKPPAEERLWLRLGGLLGVGTSPALVAFESLSKTLAKAPP